MTSRPPPPNPPRRRRHAGWLPADGRTAAADRASRGDENVRHDQLFRILLGPPQASTRRSRASWRTSRTSRAVSPRGRTVVRAAGGSTEVHVGFHRRGRVPSAGERGSERASGVWPHSPVAFCGAAARRAGGFSLISDANCKNRRARMYQYVARSSLSRSRARLSRIMNAWCGTRVEVPTRSGVRHRVMSRRAPQFAVQIMQFDRCASVG